MVKCIHIHIIYSYSNFFCPSYWCSFNALIHLVGDIRGIYPVETCHSYAERLSVGVTAHTGLNQENEG